MNRLRELLDEADTLPWYAQWEGQSYHVRGHNGSLDDFPISEGTYAINTSPPERYEREKAECDTSDADLMVAAVNAAPKLLAVVEAARPALRDNGDIQKWPTSDELRALGDALSALEDKS